MKLNVLSLSLAVAVIAAVGTPASSADWNYGAGSIKDGISAAVPVPAPVPVPEYSARYYFRADAGVGMGDAPDSSEAGYYYGDDSGYGSFPSRSSWLNDDFDTFVTLGVGVGMYIGDRFRADLTAETRTKGEVEMSGEYEYFTEPAGGNYEDVRGVVRDKTSLSGGIFMLNGYYDFSRGPQSRFTPYVGAGLGFAWNELRRTHFTSEGSRNCDDSNGCTRRPTPRDSERVTDNTHDLSFAAMATVGVGYRISDYALLDLNYRYLFIDSTNAGISIDGRGDHFGGDSNISIGELHEHQLRAGIRFEVN
ncbi:MAG: hypothetical protein APF80_09490 [Alphaproteobacteria bacterium BRH_c36]|nr:MAG: hypothetical protein APF80_09490 [Alphaproteobacteria bacterium BRH_c36]